jgi:hypothetical protein
MNRTFTKISAVTVTRPCPLEMGGLVQLTTSERHPHGVIERADRLDELVYGNMNARYFAKMT